MKILPRSAAILFLALLVTCSVPNGPSSPDDRVRLTSDGKGFERYPSGEPFTPWGFNYDHDERGRLLEDYWTSEWEKVARDFREMRQMGATVVRIHLQFSRFMMSAEEANPEALAQLRRLLQLSQDLGLRLDLTGLCSYRKSDVPAWYGGAAEKDRWAMQSRFWESVSEAAAGSPAVFSYNLMNEPVSPSGPSPEYLGGLLGGYAYVEVLTKDPGNRSREEVSREWLETMARSIRKHDPGRLITVGLFFIFEVPGGLSLGSDPKRIAEPLDFLAVHVYPKEKNVSTQEKLLATLAVGKPVVIEETFPLNCSMETFGRFLKGTKSGASGWLGFYWGKPLSECRRSKDLADAFMAEWLAFFQSEGDGFKSRDR
jgi:hypothetical protein